MPASTITKFLDEDFFVLITFETNKPASPTIERPGSINIVVSRGFNKSSIVEIKRLLSGLSSLL